MQLVHINKALQCLTIATVAQSSALHGLRSAVTAAYVKPRTITKFAECGFYFVGPDAWNSLPSHLYFVANIAAFKPKL